MNLTRTLCTNGRALLTCAIELRDPERVDAEGDAGARRFLDHARGCHTCSNSPEIDLDLLERALEERVAQAKQQRPKPR